MQIVDTALAQRASEDRPVQVGLFGAGFMARGILNQIARYTPGMRVAAICNRTVSAARSAYEEVGIRSDYVLDGDSPNRVDDAVRAGRFVVTANPAALLEAGLIDVVIDSTGHVEYGARITCAAIEAGKDIVSMNVELDATVGCVLQARARKAGVILSGCDGDQPGVQMNLLRYVKTLGLKPLLAGNIKGLQDRYRNPQTQAAFAAQWGQTAGMVTSFADGTKISMEQAIVANATGMKVAQRGMIGHEFRGHVDEMVDMYDLDQMRALGGIVDYVVGARPSPGVYVFAEAQDARQAHYLNYGKLGEGPVYSFYVPWHLTALEIHISAARVALLRDNVIAPLGAPVVDVITTAKIDSKAGTAIDALGGFLTYGQCENADVAAAEGCLPMGLAEGCVLKRNVTKDQVLTWDDVQPPTDSRSHALWAEQVAMFEPRSAKVEA